MIKFKDFLAEMAYKRMGSGKTPFTKKNGQIVRDSKLARNGKYYELSFAGIRKFEKDLIELTGKKEIEAAGFDFDTFDEIRDELEALTPVAYIGGYYNILPVYKGKYFVSNYNDPGEIYMLKGNANPLRLAAELSRKHPLDTSEE